MSTKADYTDAEWELLLEVPPLVGTAVMLAGRSGLGTTKEAFAVASGVLDGRDGYESNQLIQSLIEARVVSKQRSRAEQVTDNPYLGKSADEIRNITVAKCRQVSDLLVAKASSELEADEFKQWTVSVGKKVANAAKEGGFLGLGGQRVSAEEKTVLAAVNEALGLTS